MVNGSEHNQPSAIEQVKDLNEKLTKCRRRLSMHVKSHPRRLPESGCHECNNAQGLIRTYEADLRELET